MIGCYQQSISRLFKGNGVCNWLPTALRRQFFDITYSNFEEAFHLGQKSNRVMAVPNSYQQPITCKYQNIIIEKSSPLKG